MVHRQIALGEQAHDSPFTYHAGGDCGGTAFCGYCEVEEHMAPKTTVYYRYKNAPTTRFGGPWWHRQFATEEEANVFIGCGCELWDEHIAEANHKDCGTVFGGRCESEYPKTSPHKGTGSAPTNSTMLEKSVLF